MNICQSHLVVVIDNDTTLEVFSGDKHRNSDLLVRLFLVTNTETVTPLFAYTD